MNEIHGHQVMEKMLETGKVYTKETLLQDIENWFGKDVRFFTCFGRGLTPEELIDFLLSKGKFSQVEGGFKMEPSKTCDH